jgi:transcription termination/antitermination protein NusG
MEMRWYVVHAYSGFEQSVKRALVERIARFGMQEKFGEVLVPTEEVVEMRNGQKRRSDRKFYPGYVLVQIATQIENKNVTIDDECWHIVRETPKVMGFIGGTKEKPLPIKESEAQVILQRVQDSIEKPKPKILFEVGEMVRVIHGNFNGFDAVVSEVQYEKSRMKAAVQIFGRSTQVELEFAHVEKMK